MDQDKLDPFYIYFHSYHIHSIFTFILIIPLFLSYILLSFLHTYTKSTFYATSAVFHFVTDFGGVYFYLYFYLYHLLTTS